MAVLTPLMSASVSKSPVHTIVPVPVPTASSKPSSYPKTDGLTEFKHWFTEVDYGNKDANKWIQYCLKKHGNSNKEYIKAATKLATLKNNKVILKFLQS